jgi:MoxR-like ATPase
MTSPIEGKAKPVVDTERARLARAEVVGDVYMDERVKDYIVEVVFATREPTQKGLKELAR